MSSRPIPFPELIPQGYLDRFSHLGEDSPPARAVRETAEEYEEDPDALSDPIGEEGLKPLPNLVRKYRNRALFLATSKCLVHCRFCFRRTVLEASREPKVADLDSAALWLSRNPEVREVIISGGDPLALSDSRLSEIMKTLGSVDSIRQLRIHTRAPVVIPERVTGSLTSVLSNSPRPVALVLHVAHPCELTDGVSRALGNLKACANGLMAQTVLLRGINDDPQTLANLFDKLREYGIAPRYLHHPDRVPGARVFRLSLARGLEIFRDVKGLCAEPPPPYVIDLPDGSGKTEVSALKIVGTERSGEKVAHRYRWDRPIYWEGVSGKEFHEWWDIPE